MQSDGLTDEYNKKLNEIIQFFKTEKEGQIYFQDFRVEERRYNQNVILSTVVIFIGISNAFLIVGPEFKNLALVLIVITLFMVVSLMFSDLRSSRKRIENIVQNSNKYNFIINNLQSLKILPYEVDLSKLIDKMKYRYHLKNTPFIDENYIFETWFVEVRDCLAEINKQILEPTFKRF
jgi:hypothetical protein